MSKRTANSILTEALSAYQDIDNPRIKEILQAAIKHVHAFASELKLTHEEWLEGIEYLTEIGHMCTDGRQEFILLSDLLGLSALVELQDRDAMGIETPGSVVGPFHATGSPFIPIGGSIDLDHVQGGETALVRGKVRDMDGNPIAGAELDIWQTAPNQLYAIQDENQSENNLRGKQLTDEEGNYGFITVKPVPYTVPRDGPCGRILDVSGRHGLRTAHIHIKIEAEGVKPLTTEIYPDDDPYLDDDTVFGACQALTMQYVENTDSSIPVDLIGEFDFFVRRDGNA